MTNFIRYKDEIINLDLVVKISKDQSCNRENEKIPIILFYGNWLYRDGTNAMISLLEFDNEEIRDKIFYDICHNIQFNYRSTFIEIKNEQ